MTEECDTGCCCSKITYLDNAATSWPKPPEVSNSMKRFIDFEAANPGRSGHEMAKACGGMVHELRLTLVRMLGARDPRRIIFTFNATDAANLALRGVVEAHRQNRPEIRPHIVSTIIEHNAVRRPLNALRNDGLIDLTLVDADEQGFVDPDEIIAATNERTMLIAVMHASNVSGAIQPIAEIGSLLRLKRPDALFMIDAAQTMGGVPIDVEEMNVDLLCFTGHKSLLGPTGVGGLYVGERAYEPEDERPRLRSVRHGGTGADSESPVNPRELPAYLEAGTPNAVGLCGLRAAVEHAPPQLIDHERRLVQRLIDGLTELRGVRILGPRSLERRTGALSITVDGHDPAELSAQLSSKWRIATRAGLHCAPGAHRMLGTHPAGALRFSPGPYNTATDIDLALDAMRQLLRRAAPTTPSSLTASAR